MTTRQIMMTAVFTLAGFTLGLFIYLFVYNFPPASDTKLWLLFGGLGAIGGLKLSIALLKRK